MNISVETKLEARQKSWSIYVIRCANNSLYCGITNDIDRRFSEHQSMGKKTAKYLRGKGPLQLVYAYEVGDRSAALKLEASFKALPKHDKERIVRSKKLNLMADLHSVLLLAAGVPESNSGKEN